VPRRLRTMSPRYKDRGDVHPRCGILSLGGSPCAAMSPGLQSAFDPITFEVLAAFKNSICRTSDRYDNCIFFRALMDNECALNIVG